MDSSSLTASGEPAFAVGVPGRRAGLSGRRSAKYIGGGERGRAGVVNRARAGDDADVTGADTDANPSGPPRGDDDPRGDPPSRPPRGEGISTAAGACATRSFATWACFRSVATSSAVFPLYRNPASAPALSNRPTQRAAPQYAATRSGLDRLGSGPTDARAMMRVEAHSA